MFPLNCACVHAGHEMSAQNKTWSTHKCLLKKFFFHIYHYTSFQIQMSSHKMLHKRNFMRTQTLRN